MQKKDQSVAGVIGFLVVLGSMLLLNGCKKIAGLPLQENEDYHSGIKNVFYDGSAWKFIKDRAIEGDSIFYNMYQAIQYSEIDTTEYMKPNRTYIVYTNIAVTTTSSSGSVSTSSYFGRYKVKDAAGKLVAATSWTQYPKEQVKNHLLSLIIPGNYTFETLNNLYTKANTLMPVNYDSLNTKSEIVFNLTNDRASTLMINANPGSVYLSTTVPGLKIATGGYITTNGPVHVAARVVYSQRQQFVWDLIQDRGIRGDSIFNLLHQAVQYSGIDTNEYNNIGRTYLLYTNDAILRKVNGVVTDDCYFGKYKVNGQPATSWADYPKEQVKNHLLSLIALGEYTLSTDTARIYTTTLMPLKYDSLNPSSKIVFYPRTRTTFRINDFPGSQVPRANLSSPGIGTRTSGYPTSNGAVHFVDRVVFYQSK